MWIKKEMPLIPGYESLGDSVEAKRWLDFKLDQLFAIDDSLLKYINSRIPGSGVNLKTREDICKFVIAAFDYPLRAGVPTDKHYNNWFDGSCCHTISLDYWQSAIETVRTLRLNRLNDNFAKGFGDCEDVSILFVALFLAKKWKVWECFGAVYENSQLLGYHGWDLFQDEDGFWRLYEATLSEYPEYPSGYFIADPNVNDWHLGSITYHATIKLIRKEYYEWGEEEMLGKYLSLKLGNKETRKKYEAISRAWGKKTKPLTHLGILSKLRWRR